MNEILDTAVIRTNSGLTYRFDGILAQDGIMLSSHSMVKKSLFRVRPRSYMRGSLGDNHKPMIIKWQTFQAVIPGRFSLYYRNETDEAQEKSVELVGVNESYYFQFSNSYMVYKFCQRISNSVSYYPLSYSSGWGTSCMGKIEIKAEQSIGATRNGEFELFQPNSGDLDYTKLSLIDCFVSTSHNTYLSSSQIYGPSHCYPYIRALMTGCRCLELDFWDGPDGLPVITHGFTFTECTGVPRVLEAISEYCFITCNTPIILSFENHCCYEQLEILAGYIVNAFGSLLVTREEFVNMSHIASTNGGVHTDDTADCLNVPISKLLGRILIKSKLSLDIQNNVHMQHDEELKSKNKSPKVRDSGSGYLHTGLRRIFKKKMKVSCTAYDIIIALPSTRFKKYPQHYPIATMAEGAYHKFDQTSIKMLTSSNLVRMFPSPRRILSSNYDPSIYWNCGMQMVALNYQTFDIPMLLNFALTGKNGYARIPEHIKHVTQSTTTKPPERSNDSATFHCELLGTTFCNDSELPVYAHVSIIDFFLGRTVIEKYMIIDNIGSYILWKKKELSCEVSHRDSMFLVIALHEKQKSLLYGRAALLSDIKPGMIKFPLYNKNFIEDPMTCSYMKITME